MTGTRGKNKSDTIMTCNLSLQELRQNLGPSLVDQMKEVGGRVECDWPLFGFGQGCCRTRCGLIPCPARGHRTKPTRKKCADGGTAMSRRTKFGLFVRNGTH